MKQGYGTKGTFALEFNGAKENREHLYAPMSRSQRQAAGLRSWKPRVDYGEQGQGGHDANYRGFKPKSKAKAQKTSSSSWSGGTQAETSSWVSGGTQTGKKRSWWDDYGGSDSWWG